MVALKMNIELEIELDMQRKQSINLQRFKLYYTAQVCNKTKKRRLMKSHLKMWEEKYANSMKIMCKYANDFRHSNQAQRTEIGNIEYVVQKSINAYIFWKFWTLFVHFAVDINEQITQLAKSKSRPKSHFENAGNATDRTILLVNAKYVSIEDWQITKRQNADTRIIQVNTNAFYAESIHCNVM
ncbi:hypothetical protein RFI_25793 [Reticulomyxa filosa]|uniref:Uncharacterized protein n=1 Tax=Reticulomyxa filosa TaxID=46433 RepID=X6MC38_RETFI|nr:hypothetical protein RFI_25793 [Reticulomyxa filosa]|eukprot:ETO11583.1 hypothetical protein RFI_25793 [Reticulomyxa filosa]